MRLTLPKVLAAILGITLICAATHFYLDWRTPRATATIQVHPEKIYFSGQKNRSYMENQFDRIYSKETMERAAQILKSDTRPQALKGMAKNIEASPVRGTDYIKITAKGQSNAQAIKTANAVAEAYTQIRSTEMEARAERALEALDEELSTQELKTQELKKTQDKESYEQARLMLREMKLKQEEARVLLKMPQTPITIHERAK